MFAPPRYLQWARRFFGQVRFDMATSGIPWATMDSVAPTRAIEVGPWDAPERLRDAIAAHNDVPRDEVAPAFGTTHAIWLACATLVDGRGVAGGGRREPDEVLVEAPAYEPLAQIPAGCGAIVRTFTRDAARAFALDPEAIARAIIREPSS